MIHFVSEKGLVSFAETLLDKGKISFNFAEFKIDSTSLKWQQTRADTYQAEYMGCLFRIDLLDGILKIEVCNQSGQDLLLTEIIILCHPHDLTHPPTSDAFREYIHSFDLAEKSGVKKVGLANRYLGNNPESSMVYVLQSCTEESAWLFAVLPPHQGDYVFFQACHDQPHMEGTFGLQIRFSFQSLLQKQTGKISTSGLECLSGAEPLVLLEELGEQWARELGAKLKPRKVGWNSWDYFAGAVTSRNIFDNQDAAGRHFGKRIEYYVIDEGWEARWGIWETNWKFPEGAEGFCHRIREHGGVPGIWTAPLLVNAYTDIYREHPDWFGRDEAGQVVSTLYAYGPMAYLDITHPEAEKWLYKNFRHLRQAGFEYFKVDFTTEVLKCKNFRDRTLPRGMIIRRAFEIIRQAIGPEAYLLACGAPYESVTGLADAVRTSGDIHNFWGHVLRNLVHISARWWMDGRLWNNDPDFLVIRTPETNKHPQLNREFTRQPFKNGCWQTGREMNEAEASTYALLVYAAAGDLFLGDDLNSLNEHGIELLHQILEEKPLMRAARPLDLFASHEGLPNLWLADEIGRKVLFVFNWEEDSAGHEINLAHLGLENYQSVRVILNKEMPRIEQGFLQVRLEPRRGIALEFKH